MALGTEICTLQCLLHMHILIIAATALEIRPFLNRYRDGAPFLRRDMNIDVLITGIGLTATVYRLMKQLTVTRPDFIIQAGVAGCFDTSIPLGSVVTVRQDTIADESVIELKKLRTLFDLNLVPQNRPPYRSGWLVNPHRDLIKSTGLTAVRGISVNQITTKPETIYFFRDRFRPVTESMEGAALHYVCLLEGIPFLQLRSLSNYIGERNKKKWNMQDSILRLNDALEEVIPAAQEVPSRK